MQRAMMVHRRDRMSANPTRLGMGTLLDEETDTLTFDLLGTEEPNLYPLPMGATPVAATAAKTGDAGGHQRAHRRHDVPHHGRLARRAGRRREQDIGRRGLGDRHGDRLHPMAAAERRQQLASLSNCIISPVTADGIDISGTLQQQNTSSLPMVTTTTVPWSRNDVELGWNLSDDILKQFAAMSAGERSPKKKLFRREDHAPTCDATPPCRWIGPAPPKTLRSKRKSVWVAADVLHSKRRRRPGRKARVTPTARGDGNSDTSSSKERVDFVFPRVREERRIRKEEDEGQARVSKSPRRRLMRGKASSRSKSASNSKAASSSSSTSTSARRMRTRFIRTAKAYDYEKTRREVYARNLSTHLIHQIRTRSRPKSSHARYLLFYKGYAGDIGSAMRHQLASDQRFRDSRSSALAIKINRDRSQIFQKRLIPLLKISAAA